MTQSRLVTLRLPLDLIARIEARAHEMELAPGEVIRGALEAALTGVSLPEPSREARERAALRASIARAEGWLSLQSDLRRQGFVLRLHEGTQLAVHSWPEDRFLLWLDTLGHDIGTLSLAFRAPFPGAPPFPTLRPAFKSGRGVSGAA